MKYPKFLNENNNTIGACAMSSGVGHKLDSFDESMDYIQSFGFHIVESSSVRMIVSQVVMPRLVLMN